MKKKAIWLMACLMAFLIVLAACGNNGDTEENGDVTGGSNGNGEPATGEEGNLAIPDIPGFPLETPMTISVLGRHVGVADWEDMPFWQAMTEATNISWEFTLPPNDDFLTNLNLAFATQNLPDVLFGSALTSAQQVEHGSVGTLIPLQDLIAEHAPNIQRLLDENPTIRTSITAPDGNIYALPTIDQSFSAIWPVGPVYFNGTWMEALDAEIPTTLDEFTDLMFRFRDEMPEILGVDQVFPISATDEMQWLRLWMLSFWGMTTRTIEATDGVVVHNVTTDAYRAYLEWMHMAFEEGLIHPEIYTLSHDHHNALGGDNLVGFFQSWHSNGFLQTDEEQALDNPMLRPLTSEFSEGVLPRSTGFSPGQFAITNNAADPVTIIRWIDWLYTEEGAIFADHGPEGAFWVYEAHAETGEQVRVFTPGVDPEDGHARARFTPYFGFPGPQLIPAEGPRILRDAAQSLETPLDDFLREETRATVYTYGRVPIPTVMFTPEEADAVAIINADLLLEMDMQEASFVTGITPLNDETWAEFLATLDQIGMQELVAAWQAAYDRWLEASS